MDKLAAWGDVPMITRLSDYPTLFDVGICGYSEQISRTCALLCGVIRFTLSIGKAFLGQGESCDQARVRDKESRRSRGIRNRDK